MYEKGKPKKKSIMDVAVDIVGMTRILIKLEENIEIGLNHECSYGEKCGFCEAIKELADFIKKYKKRMVLEVDIEGNIKK